MTPAPQSRPLARAAHSISAGETDQVLALEQMPALAGGRPARDAGGAEPASDVFAVRDRGEVVGIDAPAIPAHVIDIMTRRDLSFEEAIGRSMREHRSAVKLDEPIAGPKVATVPRPAIRGARHAAHTREEAGDERGVSEHDPALYLTWDHFDEAVHSIATFLKRPSIWPALEQSVVSGWSRGGIMVAVALSYALGRPYLSGRDAEDCKVPVIWTDSLVRTGATLDRARRRYAANPQAGWTLPGWLPIAWVTARPDLPTLHVVEVAPDRPVVFPWEPRRDDCS